MHRVVKYDVLRVVACFAIVLLHVSASYWSVVDVHGSEFLVMTIYNSLTRFAVPVFFMLSGMFMVSPARQNTGMGKRIVKIVILFYVWSAFYAFQGVAVDALTGSFTMEAWNAAVERFIFGHVHMWFLQILVGCYLLLPVARQICAKKEVAQYYLILWIVFRFIVPYVTEAFGWSTFQARIDSLGLDLLVGNFGYFLLGYYLNETEIKKEARRVLYALGIAAVGLTIILTIQNSVEAGTYVDRWFNPSTPNVLVMSIAIFTCFKYSEVFDRIKNVSMWKTLSRYTFFVYMFHMFVLEKLNLVGISTISFPAIISVPVLTLVIIVVSLIGAFVADHIPVVKKIVMLH